MREGTTACRYLLNCHILPLTTTYMVAMLCICWEQKDISQFVPINMVTTKRMPTINNNFIQRSLPLPLLSQKQLDMRHQLLLHNFTRQRMNFQRTTYGPMSLFRKLVGQISPQSMLLLRWIFMQRKKSEAMEMQTKSMTLRWMKQGSYTWEVTFSQ